MEVLGKKSFSLKQLVMISWLAPAVLTLFASVGVFAFLGWLDYQNNIDLVSNDLSQKSNTAARRLSAEIMLQELGSVEAVRQKLIDELNVKNFEIESSAPCPEHCVVKSGDSIEAIRKIPHIDETQFLVASQPIRPYPSFLNPTFLMWSTLPVFLLITIGLLIQLYFLRRQIISPVNLLVDAAENQLEVQAAWPREFQLIGHQLVAAFKAREQAVFAMLAKGVIHDIKTFLHSLLIATDLIDEAKEEKRIDRLGNLHAACKSNLPKIRRIIELTLDGSREIPMRPQAANMISTIKGAIDANAGYAAERHIGVILKSESDDLMAVHDPVQLERAFANIIKNGIEAIPNAGRTASDKGDVIVSVKNLESHLEISIEDSGPGFSEDSEFNFMPVKSQKAHGAGLGLYITKKIIQGHQGSLQIARSDALGGAKLSVMLPMEGTT